MQKTRLACRVGFRGNIGLERAIGVDSNRLGKKALVVGASIAGLLAARVLSDHFEEVVLIDRDSLPEDAMDRKGVPQGRYYHVLLIRGQESLERFFPGFAIRLDEAGAPYVKWLSETRLCVNNGWLNRNDLNITTRNITRPKLEWIIREELKNRSNISFVDNCQADGLMIDNSGSRIIGLNVSYRRNAANQAGKTALLEGDLVIDASGRNSKLPMWLQSLGYEKPAKTEVNSWLGYSSRFYSKLSYDPDWKVMVMNSTAPDQPRGGSISLHENGQWMVTLTGYGRQHQPPTDPDEFLAFAKSLVYSDVYDAIATAIPSSEIGGFANTSNIWSHFEQLNRLPVGLIALGDSVGCFNPIYGQGMTTAALAAEALDAVLSDEKSIGTVGIAVQKRLAKILNTPWLMATAVDFQYPETEGKRPGGFASILQRYFDRLLANMRDDAQTARTFIEVLNMVKTPTSLFDLGLIGKALKIMPLRSGD